MQFFSLISNSISERVSHLSSTETIIFNIALILVISAVFGLIARLMKQPLIPAYILTGLIMGPLVLGLVKDSNLVYAFSEIGIVFLLFTAGLEISFRSIKEANLKKILLIGIFQVFLVFVITLLLKSFLGLNTLQASYMGIILAFGSTMIDIKLLADKNELMTIHGRVVLGILLLQDLVAIAAIIIFTSGGFALATIGMAFVKLLLLIGFAILLHKFVLNRLFEFAAKSTELLFLSSLSILFLFITLSYISELSIVIGAFIAGVSIANSKFKQELESRITPLRDFFAILFFVVLGMQFVFDGVNQRILLLIGLIVITLFLKPLITFLLLRMTGYHQKTSFLASLSLSQLSEFSLIIGMLGVSLGVFDNSVFSTIILATIITMSLTPYFIDYSHSFYRIFRYPLKIFKFLPMSENLEYGKTDGYEILLIGSHRIGSSLLRDLMHKKEKLLVVDYNPEIIKALISKKIPCIYGDVYSSELLSKINLRELKVVVSTVPGFKENLYLLKRIKRLNKNIKVIVTSGRISDSETLYSEGADYIIMPKILAGEQISELVGSRDPDFSKLKERHLKHLKELHKLLY